MLILTMFFVSFELRAQSNVSYSIEAAALSFNYRNYGFMVDPYVHSNQFAFGIETRYSAAPSVRMVYSDPHGSLAFKDAHYLALSVNVQYQFPSKSTWNESLKLGFAFLNMLLSRTEIENGVVTEKCQPCRDDTYVTLGAKTSKRFGEKISVSVMPFFSYYFTHNRLLLRTDIGLQLSLEYLF